MPTLDSETRADFQEFCVFTEEHLDRISEITSQCYAQVPSFRPLLAGLTVDAVRKQHGENIVRLKRAAFEDDWSAYLENLRARGRSFAKAGVAFTDWTEVFQRSLVLHVDLACDAYVTEAARLRRALRGMSWTFDMVVQTIGATFFDAHRDYIRALSTPVLQIAARVLLVPLIGELDHERASQLSQAVLSRARQERARHVVVDLTGVPHVDSTVVDQLAKLTKSANLMGCRVVLCGIAPDVCRSLVELGADMPVADTFGALQDALDDVLAQLP